MYSVYSVFKVYLFSGRSAVDTLPVGGIQAVSQTVLPISAPLLSRKTNMKRMAAEGAFLIDSPYIVGV